MAMMHIFCQSLIGCSRSVDRAAHGPQTRQMAVFDRSQSENDVRCCRLLAASVLLPSSQLTFFDAATFQGVLLSGFESPSPRVLEMES